MASAVSNVPDPSAGRACERALVAGLQRGDAAAWERLVREHGGAMRAVARRFLRDEEDARDAVQEAILSASRSIRFFRGTARLSTWLHRITVNTCLMTLRAQRRRPTVSLEDLPPRLEDTGRLAAEPAAAAQPDPGETLDADAVRARVRACIERLPDPYRAVLQCRDIEGLDTAEAGRLLGVRPETVKTRLHRARQALRTLVERECGELLGCARRAA